MRTAALITLAFIALTFSNGVRAIPIAAWIGPALLVRLLRTRRSRGGLALGYLTLAGATAVQLAEALGPMHGPLVMAGIVLAAGIFFVPYLLDRGLAPRIPGFASTLVLPLAQVSCDLVFSHFVADVGFLGYTQVRNTALLQIASVTGIFGMTFLVVWFASVINWTAERGMDARRGLLIYTSTLAALLFAGNLREQRIGAPGDRVRVASLTLDATEAAHAGRNLRSADSAHEPLLRAEAGRAMRALFERLLARSAEEARAGAKIVLWSEANGHVLAEDEEAMIVRAADVARTEHVYLFLAIIVFPRGAEPMTNEIVVVDDQGQIAARHLKSFLSPGEPSVKGEGRLPVIASSYGTLSAAICAEYSNHRLIAQSGRAGADILFDASSEWEPLSTSVAIVRAVENGAALVKQTLGAPSIATDASGRVLARIDPARGRDTVMVASVPTRGVRTIYAVIGDAFAYACGAALLVLAAIARRTRVTPASKRDGS